MSTPDVTVVGAGLLGLASAWALRLQGCSVRIIEAHDEVALETSYANAGMLTPSMADPWNAPGVWRDLLRWVGREDAPMLIRPSALPQYLRWGLRFLNHSRSAHHQAATQANFALAMHSLRAFQEWRQTHAWDYALRTRGTLQVFRDPQALARACHHVDFLAGQGMQARVLSAQQLTEIEPLLAGNAQLVGGVHFPDDETGDARQFCLHMAQWLREQGVEFVMGQRVSALRVEHSRVVAISTAAQDWPVQQLVLATAAHTSQLLRPHGVKLAIQPVKGYSLSLCAPENLPMPGLALNDHHLHAAMTPLDGSLRLAGTAEFSGWDKRLHTARIDNLWGLLKALLPQHYAQWRETTPTSWCGFRPMSADGLPYIGPTPLQGVFVNTGHGALGWTQSLGSAQLLAAQMSGSKLPLNAQPFRVMRD